ncbi:NAD(P)-dependent alcohol dehydrogenase, partial [Actinomadura adrarensis]
MKAIVQDVYGDDATAVLEQRDIGRPVPSDDQVLIRVRAAGVDPGLWHLMTGRPYLFRLIAGMRRPRQRVQGSDVAGVV